MRIRRSDFLITKIISPLVNICERPTKFRTRRAVISRLNLSLTVPAKAGILNIFRGAVKVVGDTITRCKDIIYRTHIALLFTLLEAGFIDDSFTIADLIAPNVLAVLPIPIPIGIVVVMLVDNIFRDSLIIHIRKGELVLTFTHYNGVRRTDTLQSVIIGNFDLRNGLTRSRISIQGDRRFGIICNWLSNIYRQLLLKVPATVATLTPLIAKIIPVSIIIGRIGRRHGRSIWCRPTVI